MARAMPNPTFAEAHTSTCPVSGGLVCLPSGHHPQGPEGPSRSRGRGLGNLVPRLLALVQREPGPPAAQGPPSHHDQLLPGVEESVSTLVPLCACSHDLTALSTY